MSSVSLYLSVLASRQLYHLISLTLALRCLLDVHL